MKLFLLFAIVFVVLFSGCLQQMQGKFKLESTVLCDKYWSLKNMSKDMLGTDISEVLAIEDCINACGSEVNYSSWDCSGKYFACYCEKDPTLIAPAANSAPATKSKEEILAQEIKNYRAQAEENCSEKKTYAECWRGKNNEPVNTYSVVPPIIIDGEKYLWKCTWHDDTKTCVADDKPSNWWQN